MAFNRKYPLPTRKKLSELRYEKRLTFAAIGALCGGASEHLARDWFVHYGMDLTPIRELRKHHCNDKQLIQDLLCKPWK